MGQNFITILYLSCQYESGANRNNESKKAFVKTMEYVWSQNKDKWAEEVVNSPIEYVKIRAIVS